MSFVSKILATLGVLAVTLGLTSFYLQATVFAPEQTRAAVTTLLEDPAARNLVASQLVDAVAATLPQGLAELAPEGIPLPEGVELPEGGLVSVESLRAAADAAIQDPRLVSSAADAVVAAHELVIGEGDARPALDSAAVSAAFADAIRPTSALVADRIAAQPVDVVIPVRVIPGLSLLNSLTSTYAFPLTALGVVLCAAAIVISPRKARTMRRIGTALVALTALQAVALWLLPEYVAPMISSDLAQTLAAVLSALASQALPYILGGLAAGAALIVASFLVPSRPAPGRGPARPAGVAPVAGGTEVPGQYSPSSATAARR